MPTVTRAELSAALHPDCTWSAQSLTEAIAVGFPGKGPVDLLELIEWWLNDAKISRAALGQASQLAATLAPAPPVTDPPTFKLHGSLTNGRAALERIKAALSHDD